MKCLVAFHQQHCVYYSTGPLNYKLVKTNTYYIEFDTILLKLRVFGTKKDIFMTSQLLSGWVQHTHWKNSVQMHLLHLF